MRLWWCKHLAFFYDSRTVSNLAKNGAFVKNDEEGKCVVRHAAVISSQIRAIHLLLITEICHTSRPSTAATRWNNNLSHCNFWILIVCMFSHCSFSLFFSTTGKIHHHKGNSTWWFDWLIACYTQHHREYLRDEASTFHYWLSIKLIKSPLTTYAQNQLGDWFIGVSLLKHAAAVTFCSNNHALVLSNISWCYHINITKWSNSEIRNWETYDLMMTNNYMASAQRIRYTVSAD